MIAQLEAASLAASQALDHSTPAPYRLLIGRRLIDILPREKAGTLSVIPRLFQGLPVGTTLFQLNATGTMGPFAKRRKQGRRKVTPSDNALLFWTGKGEASNGKARRMVLKAAIGHGNLKAEIEALRIVHASTGLAPEVIAADPQHKWVVMEFIPSAGVLDPKEQARLYLDKIAEPFFAAMSPANVEIEGSDVGNDNAFTELHNAAADLGINPETLPLSGSMTHALTHDGGICEECLLSEDGRPFLLDWEKARIQPIAVDLLQVFEHFPDETLAIFERLIPTGGLSARQQLLRTLAIRHARNRKRRSVNPKLLRSDRQCAENLRSA